MASHQSDQENKTQTQTSDNIQSPPTSSQHSLPPPANGGGGMGTEAGYYPAMGYPPPMYPSPPPGYFHHPQGYNSYRYAQAPPAAYYHSAMHPQQMPRESPFVRAILLTIVGLVMFMCASSIIMWLILRPEIPGFALSTLSVSNFNTTSPVFAANWVVNLTVHNTNSKLTVYFDKIQSLVFFDDEDLLASSFSEPFYMTTKTSKAMVANLTAGNGPGQVPVASWVVEKMGKDRGNGAVRFDFRMLVLTIFKSGSWWSRRIVLTIHCDGIKVNFVGNTGNGIAVLSPQDGECLVSVVK